MQDYFWFTFNRMLNESPHADLSPDSTNVEGKKKKREKNVTYFVVHHEDLILVLAEIGTFYLSNIIFGGKKNKQK